MKKTIALLIISLFLSATTVAQLSSNPWKDKSPVKDKQSRVVTKDKKAPNTLHQELPDFVGTNTTWNTAMGQEMIAPDVNITNMLLMTQHLRDMGYQIPKDLDNVITTAPKKLREQILESMQYVSRSSHPASRSAKHFANVVENKTGFSLENLILNSIRIIDARR